MLGLGLGLFSLQRFFRLVDGVQTSSAQYALLFTSFRVCDVAGNLWFVLAIGCNVNH